VRRESGSWTRTRRRRPPNLVRSKRNEWQARA